MAGPAGLPSQRLHAGTELAGLGQRLDRSRRG
jgi:hypothetical protein